MDVTGDRSKVRCYKEQYCIGTWDVRFMNQGKLEVVKQQMARVNVNILGISGLKWTGMGRTRVGGPRGGRRSGCKDDQSVQFISELNMEPPGNSPQGRP